MGRPTGAGHSIPLDVHPLPAGCRCRVAGARSRRWLDRGRRQSPRVLAQPLPFDGCVHLEARSPESSIEIGPGTTINNGAVIISDGPGIVIGRDCLIGPAVQIYDTDFHALDQSARDAKPRKGEVLIGERAFIGTGVIICKGVSIGDGSVVGAGSVVTSDVPSHSVAVGNPCRVIGRTDEGRSPVAPTGTISAVNAPERTR